VFPPTRTVISGAVSVSNCTLLVGTESLLTLCSLLVGWRELDPNFRFLDLGRAIFYTAPETCSRKGPDSPSGVLTTDNRRFTVHRARLAPAMISTPGHRASRRRQRGALPPLGARIARGSYSALITRTGGACIPPSRAQPAPAEIARHGFKVPRARSESFPNAAESGREIEFLTVDAVFGPS
jgi:hypothetical protein